MTSPDIITEEEFKQIINEVLRVKPYCSNIERELFLSWKWATMLWFAYYMGLRPRTIRLIEIKHIDFKNKTLFVPADNVKIRRADTFPIPEELFNKLMVYLKIRGKFHKGSPYLFFSWNNPSRAQDKNYLSDKLRKILKKLNISKQSWADKSGLIHYNKCLYSLRHSFGTRVWDKTRNLVFVGIMLGHHDNFFRATYRYIKISEDNERTNIMKQVWN